jgi:hypothetical protein
LKLLAQGLATFTSSAGFYDCRGDKPAVTPAKDNVADGIGVEELRRTMQR